jgi:hypothetical protein
MTWLAPGRKTLASEKIEFDQDSGTVTDYGKVFHFRWREIDGGAIRGCSLYRKVLMGLRVAFTILS